MNLDKEIKSIKGEFVPMSFPTDLDFEKAKSAGKIAGETIRNVLINSIANYAVSSKKEVFIVQMCAEWVIESTGSDPSETVLNFIIEKIIPQATITEVISDNGKKSATGIYLSWVMFQVYNLFGVIE